MSLVLLVEHGPVALVRLNRPEKLNALSTALERELGAALSDERVRAAGAVVFAGSDRAFSAGADLGEVRRGPRRRRARLLPTSAASTTASPRSRSRRSPPSGAGAWAAGSRWRWRATSGSRTRRPCSGFRRSRSASSQLRRHDAAREGGRRARAKELILLRRRLPAAGLVEMGS